MEINARAIFRKWKKPTPPAIRGWRGCCVTLTGLGVQLQNDRRVGAIEQNEVQYREEKKTRVSNIWEHWNGCPSALLTGSHLRQPDHLEIQYILIRRLLLSACCSQVIHHLGYGSFRRRTMKTLQRAMLGGGIDFLIQ